MSTNVDEKNNVKDFEDGFIRNLGNGKLAAQNLKGLFHSVAKSRDTTVLVRAIVRAKEKNDDGAVAAIKMVTGQLFPKATFKSPKGKAPSIIIKGIEADMDALKRLDDAVEKNLSIRHAAFRKAIVVKAQEEEKEFDPKAKAERVAKGLTKAQITALIASLQEEAKSAK